MHSAALRRTAITFAMVLGLAVALAACGSSGGSSSSTGSSSEPAATSASSEGGSEEADVAAAKKVVAPIDGKPSPFPVTEDLKEIPKGANIIAVDYGDGFSSLLFEIEEGAAKTMGVHLERLSAHTSASSISNTFDTVVAKHPDAVIVDGIDPKLWPNQLKKLQEEGVVIVAGGILEGEEYGLDTIQYGTAEDERAGKVMANYVVAEMTPNANVVMYETPELPFTSLIVETFTAELEKICPGCSVRVVQVPLSEIGNTAPDTIVSDLQANPETNVAIFSVEELQLGLPQALKAAGIEVETLGFGPTPVNLEYLKEGKATATLGSDIAALAWTQIDQAARELVGQKVTGLEAEGLGVVEFLKPEDITFDPSKGWVGYPDFAERFAKLWGVGG